jgi:hypothetical protein
MRVLPVFLRSMARARSKSVLSANRGNLLSSRLSLDQWRGFTVGPPAHGRQAVPGSDIGGITGSYTSFLRKIFEREEDDPVKLVVSTLMYYFRGIMRYGVGDLTLGVFYISQARLQRKLPMSETFAEQSLIHRPLLCSRLFRETRLTHAVYEKSLEDFYKLDLLPVGSVIMSRWNGKPLYPVYLLATDHDTRTVYVIVRGSKTISDTITNCIALPAPFMGGYAHGGMVVCAKNLVDEIRPRLTMEMNAHPTYQLKLMGHSLGGGVAVLCAFILREEFPALKCTAIAPPPLLTEHLADKSSAFVETLIHGDDIVTRFSVRNTEELYKEIIEYPWISEMTSDLGGKHVKNIIAKSGDALKVGAISERLTALLSSLRKRSKNELTPTNTSAGENMHMTIEERDAEAATKVLGGDDNGDFDPTWALAESEQLYYTERARHTIAGVAKHHHHHHHEGVAESEGMLSSRSGNGKKHRTHRHAWSASSPSETVAIFGGGWAGMEMENLQSAKTLQSYAMVTLEIASKQEEEEESQLQSLLERLLRRSSEAKRTAESLQSHVSESTSLQPVDRALLHSSTALALSPYDPLCFVNPDYQSTLVPPYLTSEKLWVPGMVYHIDRLGDGHPVMRKADRFEFEAMILSKSSIIAHLCSSYENILTDLFKATVKAKMQNTEVIEDPKKILERA